MTCVSFSLLRQVSFLHSSDQKLFNFLKRNPPDNARLKGRDNDVADKLKAGRASGNPSEDPLYKTFERMPSSEA
jgi:hypothetical protein